MKKLFGSKKQQEVPAQPAVDMNNKDQLKEMERNYKKQLQREMRELERGVLRKIPSLWIPHITLLLDNDMTQKKAEAELKKALQTTKDRSIHTIYAKQVAQCRRQKTRLLNNKAKVQGLIFSIESMFGKLILSGKLISNLLQ